MKKIRSIGDWVSFFNFGSDEVHYGRIIAFIPDEKSVDAITSRGHVYRVKGYRVFV